MMATAGPMRDATIALGSQSPARIVMAVPVSGLGACDELHIEVDEIMCPLRQRLFRASVSGRLSAEKDDEIQGL